MVPLELHRDLAGNGRVIRIHFDREIVIMALAA